MILPVAATLDTNWYIGVFAGREVVPEFPVHSIITRIELLSSPSLTTKGVEDLERFLRDGEEVALNDAVAREAASLRRRFGGRLPDAVIAAPAVIYEMPLLTRDRGMLRYGSVIALPALP